MDKYFNDYNPDLLPLIPPDARVILEVGCGTGKLCEAYRRINPKVEWRGIEKNRSAAIQAHDSGIEIFAEDAETCHVYDIGRLGERSTDCLIFGDVLEHLHDPWATLKNLARLVKPGGQVLASIPNVQHWSVILSLLRGEWQYEDDGLLDRTHLRFFTLSSIKEMFAQAGLQTFDIRGRQIGFNLEAEVMRDRLMASGIGEVFGGPEFARQSLVYQYLVRAVRSEAPVPKLHIHTVGDGTICERPRLHEPATMLSTIPGVRCSSGPLEWSTPLPQILIQQRYRNTNIDMQRRIIEHGCLIIAEIDDDPDWLKGIPESDYLPLRAVHAIQTTTEVMAETCREFCPHVAVFPNQIASLPPPREYTDGPVRIFFGALNREKDWAPIMPALNRILAYHPEVRFEVVYDRAFFDELNTMLKIFVPFCQWPEYRRILRLCDIALLPLEDNRVNRHKSDLKFLECAAEGVAVLASETVYSDPIVVEHRFHSVDERGFLYDSPEQFEILLRRLIESPEDRHEVAKKAYAYVSKERLLSQHYRRRHEWYVELASRRAELTRDLLERVPSLGPHSPVPALVESRPVLGASPA